MTDQWQELKETITELRDNNGTGTQQEVCQFLANYMEILEKQMQEPYEDEYIKVPKKALKYRTAGMVAYNAEWLKNHFDIERAVICGVQQPCNDVISCEDMEECKELMTDINGDTVYAVRMSDIRRLSFINPPPKTGCWVPRNSFLLQYRCSECGWESEKYNYCPNCGAKMREGEE